jgi:hypothetical protein
MSDWETVSDTFEAAALVASFAALKLSDSAILEAAALAASPRPLNMMRKVKVCSQHMLL